MAQSLFQIPLELWNHVFGYLSVSDKLNVRTCCKYFRRLVDHASLWRDWTVVLTFRGGSYNSGFWATLRRRRVSSAVVRSSRWKDWEQLFQSLPTLTTLVMESDGDSSQMSLDCIKHFPDLRRLAIRSSYTPLSLDASTLSKAYQLTYLSMCNVTFSIPTVDRVTSAVSQLTSLTTLVCHDVGFFEETFVIIKCILRRLPWLRHLSLSVVHHYANGPNKERSDREGVSDLLSLELINCANHLLPEDAMKLMPGLKCLTVSYKHQELTSNCPSRVSPLSSWLSDLPQLSNLAITNGPSVMKYVTSIPATVTSLTLRVPKLSSEDLTAIATRVPDLLHLHLHVGPWSSHLGAQADQIPQLFPALKRLALRHIHVTTTSFLKLHQLRNLKYLEILDCQPHLSRLIGQLQALTNNRLKVTTTPPCDVLHCSCGSVIREQSHHRIPYSILINQMSAWS